LILGLTPNQVQDPALGLVEPHEVHAGPFLNLVQVPLDGMLSLRCVSCTIQLGVIFRLAEGALNPTVSVKDEDIKLVKLLCSAYTCLRFDTVLFCPSTN